MKKEWICQKSEYDPKEDRTTLEFAKNQGRSWIYMYLESNQALKFKGGKMYAIGYE
jgi:hypothetical protein